VNDDKGVSEEVVEDPVSRRSCRGLRYERTAETPQIVEGSDQGKDFLPQVFPAKGCLEGGKKTLDSALEFFEIAADGSSGQRSIPSFRSLQKGDYGYWFHQILLKPIPLRMNLLVPFSSFFDAPANPVILPNGLKLCVFDSCMFISSANSRT